MKFIRDLRKFGRTLARLPKTLTGGFKKIGNGIKKIPKEIKGGINKVKGGFKKIEKTAKGAVSKIVGKITGIIKQIKNYANIVKQAFKCIQILFISIISHIKCGVKLVLNFPSCFLYYFLDIIKVIFIDLPIFFLIWLVPPIKDVFNYLTSIIKYVDKIVYSATNFHINRYPKQVKNLCYVCKLKPMPNFKDMGKCGKKKKKIALPPAIVYKKCNLNSD